jgi:hypothetical protein
MKYENDTSVLIVDCDCHDDRRACDLTTPVYHYPTFFLIYQQKLMHIEIDRFFDTFVGLIEKLKAMNHSITCRRHFNQSDEYPYIIVSGPDESSVCERIRELSSHVPGSSDRILLGERAERMSIVVQHDHEEFLTYTGDDSFDSVVEFAQDYIHRSFVGWPLSESRLLTYRRFGYLLMLNDWHLRAGERFILNQWRKWCFWLVDANIFQELYPQIQFNKSELPSLAIFNKERSRFRFLKKPVFGPELQELFDQIYATDDDPEMVFPFINAWDPDEGGSERMRENTVSRTLGIEEGEGQKTDRPL